MLQIVMSSKCGNLAFNPFTPTRNYSCQSVNSGIHFSMLSLFYLYISRKCEKTTCVKKKKKKTVSVSLLSYIVEFLIHLADGMAKTNPPKNSSFSYKKDVFSLTFIRIGLLN